MPNHKRTVQLSTVQRTIREQLAPKPDEADAVPEVCVDCGDRFYRRTGKRRLRCPKCAQIRGVKANVSMSRREGPVYERAVRGQLAFWLGEAERLGL